MKFVCAGYFWKFTRRSEEGHASDITPLFFQTRLGSRLAGGIIGGVLLVGTIIFIYRQRHHLSAVPLGSLLALGRRRSETQRPGSSIIQMLHSDTDWAQERSGTDDIDLQREMTLISEQPPRYKPQLR